MGDNPSTLYISGGGSATISTDEMLADLESMGVISGALDALRVQLSIADATLTEPTRAMPKVASARAAMETAWIAMDDAKGLADYLAEKLVTAIDNYTETEQNAQWLSQGISWLIVLGGTKTLDMLLGPVGGAALPFLAAWKFSGDDEAIGAHDVSMPFLINLAMVDPANVLSLRRAVMHGDAAALGLGLAPLGTAALLRLNGYRGPELSSGLLALYASQAGLLTETDVTVTKTAAYDQATQTGSSVDRLNAIPDPELRPDGAQIRIDEIHDGGELRYEVFVAGTRDFNPFSKTEPFDLTSNVAGVAGESPASYRAVQLAMQQAGISVDSQVSFTGYSQGGLIASMLAASGDYDTRGLTTYGSPAGQIIIPPGIPALIVEHYEDPIPALGGLQENTDAMVVRRYAFSEQYPADMSLPLPGHQLQYYLETASLIDVAESQKLQATVDDLNAFSSGDSVTSTWYRADREP